MTARSEAWQAYHQGNFRRALEQFEQLPARAGLAGRALTMLQMGRTEEATALVRRHQRESSTDEVGALFADLLGRQGRRADAEQILSKITSRRRGDGFYRTLLGEQRIRQGKWDQGTDDFVAGLNTGDERARAHIKKIAADLIDAVAARRVPREDARRFLNRVDYSMSNKSRQLTQFFARVRRTLNSGERVPRGDLVDPWSRAGETSAPASSTDRSQPPDPPAGQNAPPPPSTDGPRAGGDSDRSRDRSRGRQARTPSDEPAGQPPDDLEVQLEADDEETIDAQRKDMTAVMDHERNKNEKLQQLVAQVDPPIWPSNYDRPLDTIEPIGFSKESLLKASNDIETANFRITGGNIGVEIALERCMHNLVAAATAGRATTIPTVLASIPRLELNLLDDFLRQMPPVDELYREEMELEAPEVAAVGKFIGECIVQSYGGRWEYQTPVRDSVIHLGDHQLDPLGIAEEYFSKRNFEAVNMRTLIGEADRAVETSTEFPTFTDYVDPTSGMTDEALEVMLAELWIEYRFALQETELPQISSSVEVLDEKPDRILFTLSAKHVPNQLVGAAGALDSNRRVAMAYVRDTGEFLVLSSPKHFCRLLEVTDTELGRESGRGVVDWIQRLFRPGWVVATDRDSAAECRQHIGSDDISAPSFQKPARHQVVLELSALGEADRLYDIALDYRPRALVPYRLRVTSR